MQPVNPYQSPPAVRRFHASAQGLSMKTTLIVGFGTVAVVIGVFSLSGFVLKPPMMAYVGPTFLILMFAVVGLVGYLQRRPKDIVVCVLADTITVAEGTAQPRAFNEAALGPWVSMSYKMPIGTALYLRGGQEQYVLGGQDHRLPTNARLDAPPVSLVNAWMTASEFGDLLAVAAPVCRLELGAAIPGAPVRCSLYSLGLSHAIDVGEDAIWVTDLRANALVASAWLAQVSATPATYTRWGRGPRQRLPAMDVVIPGLGSLTIGCPEGNLQGKPRFAWHRDARRNSLWGTPRFTVAASDWLTLTQSFGLTPHLDDRGGGALTR